MSTVLLTRPRDQMQMAPSAVISRSGRSFMSSTLLKQRVDESSQLVSWDTFTPMLASTSP
ncbi:MULTISPECIES: hypothetical protein [Micromonospora]|uniref:hypothetical protein n=1 Tax=Micromonospora TaxID=1873 RepID=UPI003411D2CC